MNNQFANEYLVKFAIPASSFDALRRIALNEYDVNVALHVVDYDKVGLGVRLIVDDVKMYVGFIYSYDDMDKEVKKACEKLHVMLEGMLIMKLKKSKV